MATTFGSTRRGVPIAAWMVQANPAVFDVGSVLADPPDDDDWTWSGHPTYRIDVVDAGQPSFLWVTKNKNPALPSGIWLAGEITGIPYVSTGLGNVLWHDVEKQRERKPYLPMRMRTLARPILREELLAHPVLRHLEILRAPQSSNPQIITPEQLDALRADFDLTLGPLSDEVRDAIRAPYVPDLWLLGPDDTDIEVDTEDERWKVWVAGEVVSTCISRREAYTDAAKRASGELPISVEGGDQVVLAEARFDDGSAMVLRWAPDEFTICVEQDGDLAVTELEEGYSSLSDAVAALVTLGQEDPE